MQIQFENEDAMYDYVDGDESKLKDVIHYGNGSCTADVISETVPCVCKTKEKLPKTHAVTCFNNGKTMYISKTGKPCFDYASAELFTEIDADKKAIFMSQRSKLYKWHSIKMKK